LSARSKILGSAASDVSRSIIEFAKSHFRLVGLRCRAASHARQVVRHQSEMTFGNEPISSGIVERAAPARAGCYLIHGLLGFLLATAALPVSAAAAEADAGQPAVDKSAYHLFNPTPSKYMREMDVDGPGTTESPYTLDAGHFQVEMTLFGYSSYKETFDGVKYRYDFWSIGPVNLKVGLFDKLDMQLVLEPYNHVHEREDGYYEVTRKGFGDTTLRFKLNCWGNDSGRTALALTPYMRFPTSDEGLGNDRISGGLIVPASVALPGDFYLGLTGGIDKARSDDEQNYHTEYTASAALAHSLFGDLLGYVEYYNAWSTEKGVGNVGTFNAGLIYSVTDNLQLNTGVNIGLTTWADDWYGFVGMAWRY